MVNSNSQCHGGRNRKRLAVRQWLMGRWYCQVLEVAANRKLGRPVRRGSNGLAVLASGSGEYGRSSWEH